MFEPFGNSRNANNQAMIVMGNGLGLSICKQICNQLGGDIKVQSSCDTGSDFTFTMEVFEV